MKTANSALLAILSGPSNFFYADLWTFILRNGITKYYTDYATDLVVGGHTYSSSGALITGAKYKVQRGLEVDESDLTIYPAPTETVNNVPFLQAVRTGLLDRALVRRQRQFMATPGDLTSNAPSIFLGEVTDTSLSRNSCTLKVKSMINLLNIYMPRRQYQPTCSWVFGDSNCGFDRTGSAVTSTALAGSAASSIHCGLANAAGTFNSGTVKFTSGKNNGVSRSVKSYVPGVLTLNAPFPTTIGIGDSFTVYPGCNKTFSGPSQQFNGQAASGSTSTVINNNMSNSAGFFNGGTMQFTGGGNVGQIRTVSLWTPGQATLATPFPFAPAIADPFVINSVSTNTTATCTGYFGSNAALHFGGQPYVPTPETAY